MNIKVIKRDGSTEDYIPEKVVRVLIAAGLEENLALIVATNVNDWAANQDQPQITTLQIRDKVIEELGKVDPYIEGLYAWYQKSKDNMYGQKISQ